AGQAVGALRRTGGASDSAQVAVPARAHGEHLTAGAEPVRAIAAVGIDIPTRTAATEPASGEARRGRRGAAGTTTPAGGRPVRPERGRAAGGAVVVPRRPTGPTYADGDRLRRRQVGERDHLAGVTAAAATPGGGSGGRPVGGLRAAAATSAADNLDNDVATPRVAGLHE